MHVHIVTGQGLDNLWDPILNGS